MSATSEREGEPKTGGKGAPVELSVVVPVYNEEENIHELCRRLSRTLGGLGMTYEAIFVDDGSRDRSAELLAEFAVLGGFVEAGRIKPGHGCLRRDSIGREAGPWP